MIQRKKIILLCLSIMVAFFVGFVMPGDRYFQIAKNLDIFGDFFWELNQTHADDPNPTRLMRTGIDAILKSLDPYTNFYSEGEIENAKFYQAGQYSGIGANITEQEGKFYIRDMVKNGPANKVNIKIGDQILKIDDIELEGKTEKEVNDILNGESGSEATLFVKRSLQDSVFQITVGREQNRARNVPFSEMINQEVGYIKLTGFEEGAGEEVYEAMRDLQRDQPALKGVILDLRGNPGGRVDESVQISNVFLPKGEKIVEMRGRTSESQRTFYTSEEPAALELPLIVLVNSSSASASEIVAGSIQDLDRGIIIGRRSFGKGLVQNVRPLSYNTQLKITIAKYYTPSGRCIQAIDYFSNSEDSIVSVIPDSLRSSFNTKNGRIVYDGGGIEPDIEVEREPYHTITIALKQKGLIFEFASNYSATHDSIASPRSFELTDDVYEDFVSFVTEKEFEFETKTNFVLDEWKVQLKELDYKAGMDEMIGQLEGELEVLKASDLETHKEEISALLKKEILNHYYFQEGILRASFDDDPDIITSLEVLADSEKYQTLLSRQ